MAKKKYYGWPANRKKIDVNVFVKYYNAYCHGEITQTRLCRELHIDAKTWKNWMTWMIMNHGILDRCTFIKNVDDYRGE